MLQIGIQPIMTCFGSDLLLQLGSFGHFFIPPIHPSKAIIFYYLSLCFATWVNRTSDFAAEFRLKLVFNVCWCAGAASEAGDGAQRGGPKQREAAEEPAGAHRVHTHAEDHTDLHAQPLQSKCVTVIHWINAPHHLAVAASCFLVSAWRVLFPGVTEVEVEPTLIKDTVTMQMLQAAPDSSGLPC